MSKRLIIVESPTKVKTLKKFLGPSYKILSSVGHIRDLPKRGFGIDLDNKFEPHYENLPDKEEVIAKLQKAAKECDTIYLSPDPDREGEAIAWHISAILPNGSSAKRITFNAITKTAVLEALKRPRDVNMSLVNAQQARRLLDRIVGYKISPLLQRRIKRRDTATLSAGRVQSVALKLVVDREKEIDAFVSVEYWNLFADLQGDPSDLSFLATLVSVEGKKVDKADSSGKAQEKNTYTIPNEEKATKVLKILEQSRFTVAKIEKKQKRRRPVPPFITSTLQQEASRHYGYSASRTMGIAQSLYEGVDLGKEGAEGLITYMRTDSVRIEPEALQAARLFIKQTYSEEYLPEKPQVYSTKKRAQDAHEAIRPTNLQHPPESIRAFLAPDQYKLYLLIWRRFIASQMNPAIYDTVSYTIYTDHHMVLRSNGSVMKFKGFLAVYEEKEDPSSSGEETKGKQAAQTPTELPKLKEGQELSLLKAIKQQSFTKPPPRYTEASLVKELEKSGIGRPSTYAAIMNKIHSRSYTTKERLTLKPTELGKVIAAMLENHFAMIMDIQFTARMETALDEIADNKKDWKSFLEAFWEKFVPVLEKAEKEAFVPKVLTDIDCPKCGHQLQKIWARGKYFYGCSHYPECTFTVPIEALEFNKEDYAENFNWDQPCPKCSSPMKIRFGRFGAFLGCQRYPECKGIVNIPEKGEQLPDKMPSCPAIGCDGLLKQRKSRFGKTFFSCSNYPDCDVIVNHLDDLESKYADHPKTPYEKKPKRRAKTKKSAKKKTAGKKKKAPASPRQLPHYQPSEALANVIDAESVTRGEATKKLWTYIKKHNLQDPTNKRLIVPDRKLAAVFGHTNAIDMLQLGKTLTPHLTRLESKE